MCSRTLSFASRLTPPTPTTTRSHSSPPNHPAQLVISRTPGPVSKAGRPRPESNPTRVYRFAPAKPATQSNPLISLGRATHYAIRCICHFAPTISTPQISSTCAPRPLASRVHSLDIAVPNYAADSTRYQSRSRVVLTYRRSTTRRAPRIGRTHQTETAPHTEPEEARAKLGGAARPQERCRERASAPQRCGPGNPTVRPHETAQDIRTRADGRTRYKARDRRALATPSANRSDGHPQRHRGAQPAKSDNGPVKADNRHPRHCASGR